MMNGAVLEDGGCCVMCIITFCRTFFW